MHQHCVYLLQNNVTVDLPELFCLEKHPADYVGVNIKKLKDGSYEYTQQAVIDSIIDGIGLKDAKVKPAPAKVSLQLHVFKDKPLFDLSLN